MVDYSKTNPKMKDELEELKKSLEELVGIIDSHHEKMQNMHHMFAKLIGKKIPIYWHYKYHLQLKQKGYKMASWKHIIFER